MVVTAHEIYTTGASSLASATAASKRGRRSMPPPPPGRHAGSNHHVMPRAGWKLRETLPGPVCLYLADPRAPCPSALADSTNKKVLRRDHHRPSVQHQSESYRCEWQRRAVTSGSREGQVTAALATRRRSSFKRRGGFYAADSPRTPTRVDGRSFAPDAAR